uniref:polynucleotide adenylyltransferase n=1 Tax=Meloidogyne incognita TaxID=6306 RepID=A0A914L759_MELIC
MPSSNTSTTNKTNISEGNNVCLTTNKQQQECCSAAAIAQMQCLCNNKNQPNTNKQNKNIPLRFGREGGRSATFGGHHNFHRHHREGSNNSNSNGRGNYNNNNNNSNPPRQPTAVVSLNPRQVDRLRSVLDQVVEIHGRENFPTLEIPLHALIGIISRQNKFKILNNFFFFRKLRDAGLPLLHVKLNGGAASFVFAQSDSFPYSDVDLIFPIALERDSDFERVREAVFDALLQMMPSSTTNKSAITPETLRDVYIRKMVKVTDSDRWSLFSLHNDYGRCIELKFVERMRRAFEFSVDSFQITLDPLIENPNENRPIIRAESMYGDFMQALFHLNKRLIDTRNPEEIRGGGLLKYCHLLTRGFSATSNCRDMEKYMCSRFFIDFPDINVQEMKLLNYLQNHFGNEDDLKFDYLHKLFCVIRDSTVCLMQHERRQTLSMVDRLRQQLSFNLMLYYQQFEGVNGSNVIYYGNNAIGNYRHRKHHHFNNNRHWQNNRHNNRNSQVFCVSPISTIASSSIEIEQQQVDNKELNLEKDEQTVVPEFNVEIVDTVNIEENKEGEGGEEKEKEISTNVSTEQQQNSIPVVTILKPPTNRPTTSTKQATTSKQQRHVPRQTLLYLPPNASHWIPVV